MSRRCWLVCLIGWIIAAPLQAQIVLDTSRVYYLGEIEVVAEQEPSWTLGSLYRMNPAELEQMDAVNVARVLERVPSAFVQTNSRGETLVYLRNTGERQVAVFLDGALLNIPWDNRVDLQFLPANVIGGLEVARGIPSVRFGPNAAGGAINLITRRLEQEGMRMEGQALLGIPTTYQAGTALLLRRKRWDGMLAWSHAASEGMALPEGVALSYNQQGHEVRTNTDFTRTHFFARGAYSGSAYQWGMTLLHVQGEKGVAPEGHKNPAFSRVRFWRYPLWKNTMLIVNHTGRFKHGRWKIALWRGDFAQEIVQYASAAYDTPVEKERGKDETWGGRALFATEIPRGSIHLAIHGWVSTHHQQEIAFDEQGLPAPWLKFQQQVFSIGGEHQLQWTERVKVVWGGSLDGVRMPLTGDKPSRAPMVAPSFQGGIFWQVPGNRTLRLGIGQKTRFPTMRELFGEALKRFLVNPDLKPEIIRMIEVGWVQAGRTWVLEGVAFGRRTVNTIDQRVVLVDGEKRRQRINLRGSRTLGVEGSGIWVPAAHLLGELSLLYTYIRAYNEQTGYYDQPIPEKPEWLIKGRVAYEPELKWRGQLEWEHMGKAYSLDEDNRFVQLPPAWVFHLRLAYRYQVSRLKGEGFVRVENLTDAVVLPQLGLPAAGRTWLVGVNLYF